MAAGSVSSAQVQSARQRLAAGDLSGARREAEAILARAGAAEEHAAAHLVLATCFDRAHDIKTAVAHAEAALARAPDDPVAHYVHGELLEQDNDKAGAVASVRRAIALNPKFVQAHHYLGILLGESGDDAGAAAAFVETVRLDPAHTRGWNNLGNTLRAQNRLDEAEAAFARAVALKADYWLAAANLGGVQRDLGALDRAEATLRAALDRAGVKPYRPLLVLLAGVLRLRGALDESVQLYVEAINAAPAESAGEWFNLGLVLAERNDHVGARKAYGRARELDPSDLRMLLGEHLTLPMVYADGGEVDAARAGFESGLSQLERDLVPAIRAAQITEIQVLDGLRWVNFFLAYQGRDDRDLQARYAAVAAAAVDAVAPHWHAPMPARSLRGRRVRAGFASAFFHSGTCGRYFKSWITDLDRDRFEVFVYHLWPGMDDIAQAISGRADHFRTFAANRSRPSLVAPAIRADDLDVLVYTELGMDVTSFALASLRLAPRQYAAWGHPVTTGHATIDAFLSCAAMEGAAAQTHYTEPLVLLPGIGTRYEQPRLPVPGTREQFSLPSDRVLLLCPQSLWKIHPDNDPLFADILAANPRAMLVFFGGWHPAPIDRFMQRLKGTLDGFGIPIRERTRVLPQVGHDDYLRINMLCDAMVDTLHWSGGNSSLDALACGLPIVTLPGPLMRGRQSAGMLALLGVPELVAGDRAAYLAITARLTGDEAWRRGLATRILAARPQLFNVSDAIDRLQQLLQSDDILAA
ncbi:MAG TPA: tetratricopeptide repeat protein [Casimicrobiaceae bacterium]|jgi:predicted O-linked N-acetylglucosamine transferase (SPINDLY family)